MKIKKNIAFKGLPLSFVCAIFLSFTIAACDKTESDSGPNVSKEGKPNKIYLQSNRSVLIDMNALIGANKNYTFVVSSTTRQGTLSDLGSGLFEYNNKSTVSYRDGFEIKVMNGDNVVKNDSIILIIEDDPLNLPKGIYPAQDLVFGVSDGVPIEIDVLTNDYLSELTPDEINISIFSGESLPPYFGSVRINGNTITYTANASFKNADKIIYKAMAIIDTAIYAYGHVYLNNEVVCDFTVNDDTKEINEEFTQARIAGLTNDELCNSIISFQVTISKNPASGNVYIENDEFVYSPTNIATNGFEDSFEYTVCIDGVCKSAKVIILAKI